MVAFARWPELFALAAIAALPVRVPLEIGGETANLLVPLYVVIAAGTITTYKTERSARWGSGSAEVRLVSGPRTATGALRWLLAATLVLYAIQATYSRDVSNAIENVGFFLVPFAALFVLLAEVEWTARLLRRALAVVAAVAVLCALVGLFQSATRELFLNPELFDANQLHAYFRVNSIFFDPNIFGRYLALAITILGACTAWGGTRRELGLLVFASGICLAGLAFSYSITSVAAVVGGLGVVALLRWSWRGALAAGALGLAALAALLIAGGTPSSDIQSDRYFDQGRSSLLEGGVELFEDRPIAGHGSGGFGRAFYEDIERARTTISHSEPITVAAEQGVIGLAVYAALLVAALIVALGGRAGSSLARTAVAGCFVAMLVHSLGYAGFAIDPATWALLALAVGLYTNVPPASRNANVPPASRSANVPPASSASPPGAAGSGEGAGGEVAA